MHDVLIEKKILYKNDELAGDNRRVFRERGIFAVNIVGAPGAGKTSLIERCAPLLKEILGGIAVIEGDLATDLDSIRLKRLGIPVTQITTGRACHLDAAMIHRVMPWALAEGGLKILIIENVGNLVCPAEFDLGEEMMITVLSASEGADKPLKYPAIFNSSDALVINKTDLSPHCGFKIEEASSNALKINPGLSIFAASCRTGEGIADFSAFLSDAALKSPGMAV